MLVSARKVSIALFASLIGLYCEQGFAKSPCRIPVQEISYSASLQLRERVELTVGENGAATLTAREGRECLAICKVGVRKDDVAALQGDLFSMRCWNPSIGMLESRAVVLQQKRSGSARATLRFGSWLQGYRDVALDVHYDGSIKRRPKRFGPALAKAR